MVATAWPSDVFADTSPGPTSQDRHVGKSIHTHQHFGKAVQYFLRFSQDAY